MFEMLKSTDMFQASWELLIVFALFPIRASDWTLSWCKNWSHWQAVHMNSNCMECVSTRKKKTPSTIIKTLQLHSKRIIDHSKETSDWMGIAIVDMPLPLTWHFQLVCENLIDKKQSLEFNIHLNQRRGIWISFLYFNHEMESQSWVMSRPIVRLKRYRVEVRMKFISTFKNVQAWQLWVTQASILKRKSEWLRSKFIRVWEAWRGIMKASLIETRFTCMDQRAFVHLTSASREW